MHTLNHSRRLRSPILAATLGGALLLAGCSSEPEMVAVPAVEGVRLVDALPVLEGAGFEVEHEDYFEDRAVFDKDNWVVIEQVPAADASVEVGADVLLRVAKIVDPGTAALLPDGSPVLAEAQAAAGDKAAEEPATPEPEPETEEVLTAENNQDLAALLAAVEDYALYEQFSATYQGRTIEFEGTIAAINQHGDATTRYDILILAGDSIESGVTGPNFQFRDVNIVSDLHLTGANIPDTLGVGQKLRITAEVEDYDGMSDLLLLDPVSTEVRQ